MPAIARGSQVVGRVAGVQAIVEEAGASEGEGGRADRGDRDAHGEKLGSFFDRLLVFAALPGIAAGKDQHGAGWGRKIVDIKVRLDANPAHGRDGCRRAADSGDAEAARFTLETWVINTGNGKGRLPVRHAVEDVEMNRLRFHAHLRPVGRFRNDCTSARGAERFRPALLRAQSLHRVDAGSTPGRQQ